MPTKDGKGSCIPLLLLLSCGKRKRPCVLLVTHPHGIHTHVHPSIHPPHHTTHTTTQDTAEHDWDSLPTDTITLLIKPSVCKTGSCLQHGRKRGARPRRPTLFLRSLLL